ncbi:MAG: pyrroline-5-carboxylate reductase [Candidatus Omnitrophota bacterium]|nr:pyrroline-5-carboxylate reductase [Candidatus Omnitrophota bacterium]
MTYPIFRYLQKKYGDKPKRHTAIVFSGLIPAGNLYLYDIDKDKCSCLANTLNANAVNFPGELADFCAIILLAIKPQDFENARGKIREALDSSKLIISIVAGITLKQIVGRLKQGARAARVMPNMPCLVNQGVSALCYNNFTAPGDKEFVRKMFTSIGDIVEVDEGDMDAVTAVSGSGPAYFFYLTQVLEECAIDMGIDKEKAKLLAVKTAIGSAAILKDGGFGAKALRKHVTSKGGTTEAAFRVFVEKKLGSILKEGIRAAKKRAGELNKGGAK